MPELSRADETVAVLVEHTESFADFLFTEKEENLSIKWPRTLMKDVAPKETISVSIGKRMVLFHNKNIPWKLTIYFYFIFKLLTWSVNK